MPDRVHCQQDALLIVSHPFDELVWAGAALTNKAPADYCWTVAVVAQHRAAGLPPVARGIGLEGRVRYRQMDFHRL